MKATLLKKKIIKWANDLGFDGVGFTDIDLKDDEAHLLNWLENKFHGEMYYMEKHGTKRSRPNKLMPGTVRVISFRMNYLQESTYSSEKVLENKNFGYISRYALGKDYHSEMRNRLHIIAKKINKEVNGFKYRAFVDSAPVLEKAIGQKEALKIEHKENDLESRWQESGFAEVRAVLRAMAGPIARLRNQNADGLPGQKRQQHTVDRARREA